MRRLSLEEFGGEAPAYDAVVAGASYLDRFCSGADWVIPAHEALMPPRQPWLFAGDDAFVALAGGAHPRGFRYLEPLEASWGLACPVVAVDAIAGAEQLAEVCRLHPRAWDVLVVCGFLHDDPAQAALIAAFGDWVEVRRTSATERHVASLAGGLDGFLSRRSRNLRRSLRRARRVAREAGVRFEEPAEPPEQVFARILAVERRTWKGRGGVGFDVGRMRDFYRRVVARLHARGALRVLFARRDEQDLGYIFGGVFGEAYRGLQFGYDERHTAIGLGNLLQLEQVERLCAAGLASYDLGTTGAEYKHRWAEQVLCSSTLLLLHA